MGIDWSAIIVGALSLIGTALGSWGGMKLMSYRIEQLEKRVDKHNTVIERTYILEERVESIDHRVSILERR